MSGALAANETDAQTTASPDLIAAVKITNAS